MTSLTSFSFSSYYQSNAHRFYDHLHCWNQPVELIFDHLNLIFTSLIIFPPFILNISMAKGQVWLDYWKENLTGEASDPLYTSDISETFSSDSPPPALLLHYTLPTTSLFLQHFRKSHNRNKAGWKWIGTSRRLFFIFEHNVEYQCYIPTHHITSDQVVLHMVSMYNQNWVFKTFSFLFCFVLHFSFKKINKMYERETHTEWPINETELIFFLGNIPHLNRQNTLFSKRILYNSLSGFFS